MKLSEGKKYLLFLVAIHALFFILATTVGNIKLPDSIDYIWQADNLDEYGSFYAYDFSQPIKIDYYSKRPPLYGLLIWLITSIIPSLYAVLFLQNILSILTGWLVYRLVDDGFNVKNAGLWCGILWIAFPNQLLYANMVMTETLLQFFIVVAFYGFVRYFSNTNSLKYILLNNIALALAVLTKPVMLYFWLINLVLLVLVGIKYRKYILPLPVLLIPAVALLWMQHNYNQTGYRHYCSITHVNIKDYNTKFYLLSKYGEQYADSAIAQMNEKVATLPTYKAQAEYIKDTCTSIILGDVWGYGKFHARGMVNFMGDPGRFDYVNFFNVRQTNDLGLLHYLSKGDMGELKQFLSTQPLWLIIVLALSMIANGIVLVLALLVLLVRNMSFFIKLYLIAMIGYVWFLTGPIGAARFKVPIYPLIMIAAILGIEWLQNYRLAKLKSTKA